MPNLDRFSSDEAKDMDSNQSNSISNGELNKKLWATADELRSNMDAAEYKHVVLGLIFLKYISDSFQHEYDELKNDPEGLADPEEKDEYLAKNIFWVPPDARWDYLQKNAKQPTIGNLVDKAMDSIERDNPTLKGVLETVGYIVTSSVRNRYRFTK